MGRFEGQTVIVTGGSGGMGRSHVQGYHDEGANVVIAGRDDDAAAASSPLSSVTGRCPFTWMSPARTTGRRWCETSKATSGRSPSW